MITSTGRRSEKVEKYPFFRNLYSRGALLLLTFATDSMKHPVLWSTLLTILQIRKKMKKVILITGASSGMGKETARVLGRDGHIVYAAARRTDQMKDLREQGVTPLQMDITREADVQQVVDTIMAKEGRIDVLWNNAGYGLYGAVEDVLIMVPEPAFRINGITF